MTREKLEINRFISLATQIITLTLVSFKNYLYKTFVLSLEILWNGDQCHGAFGFFPLIDYSNTCQNRTQVCALDDSIVFVIICPGCVHCPSESPGSRED